MKNDLPCINLNFVQSSRKTSNPNLLFLYPVSDQASAGSQVQKAWKAPQLTWDSTKAPLQQVDPVSLSLRYLDP